MSRREKSRGKTKGELSKRRQFISVLLVKWETKRGKSSREKLEEIIGDTRAFIEMERERVKREEVKQWKKLKHIFGSFQFLFLAYLNVNSLYNMNALTSPGSPQLACSLLDLGYVP